MKQYIKATAKSSDKVEKMQQAVQQEWDRLQRKDWNRFIDRMPERLQVKEDRYSFSLHTLHSVFIISVYILSTCVCSVLLANPLFCELGRKVCDTFDQFAN